eukprot:CAMPEP_0181037026 /NCGR_PEP_ID=MMETSP1070-20121207/9180_1 /TAXON_ID=265543 /ORGANISM="Minutocellus polymorphus, Strain NH13" /LENGTH=586 /DNA_ID=CAMNT_0023114711 /DNA_START=153 /DNA_END=1913 /DNA_ORIENTATION=+
MDDDDHKKEQDRLRSRRKAAKTKPKSQTRQERESKKKEHIQRVLAEQERQKRQKTGDGTPSSSSAAGAAGRSKSPGPGPGGDKADATGGSSAFGALFTKRTEGFLIDLKFRNAPPRPPVGPCFVGLGLEGELTDKWTKYKPQNAVEQNYAWKLHAEADLGVPLAPSAMDLAGCYADPTRPTKDGSGQEVPAPGPPDLHPDDEALINWAGPKGDTAAEELQKRRDRRRAEALGVANVGGLTARSDATAIKLANRTTAQGGKSFKSRVLNENIQSWMKKTTYLTNDQTRSVHQFKSLAHTKKEAAADIDAKLKTTTELSSDRLTIEAGFDLANQSAATGAAARRHPTKRGVTAVFDFPLLPDASTWGHKYTHVVLDKPPGQVPGRKRPPPNAEQLERAFVSDVAEREVDERQAGTGGPDKSGREFDCNLLVPTDLSAALSSEPTGYDVAQRYDMTVLTLKDAENPHNNFILMVDEDSGTVTYHTLWTRLNLSSGRPGKEDEPDSTIAKVAVQEEDLIAMERVVAEVDDDLARKHGVGEYEGAYGHDGSDDDDDVFGSSSSKAAAASAAAASDGGEEKKEHAADDEMEE